MPTLQFKGKNIIWNHHLSVPYHSLEENKKLHFQPDKGDGNLIIEGEHLLGNKDSIYKKDLLDLMTNIKKTEGIKRYQQLELKFEKINDQIKAYFVKQNKEEMEIRTLFTSSDE